MSGTILTVFLLTLIWTCRGELNQADINVISSGGGLDLDLRASVKLPVDLDTGLFNVPLRTGVGGFDLDTRVVNGSLRMSLGGVDLDTGLFNVSVKPGVRSIDLDTGIFNVSVKPMVGVDDPDTVRFKARIDEGYWYSMAVVIPAGLLCNVFSISVFSLSSSLRRTTTGHYLTALACADSLFLLGDLIRWMNFKGNHLHTDFMHRINFFCKLTFILRYGGKLVSAWMTVAIVIERLLTVAMPLKVSRVSTARRARVVIILIYITGFTLGLFPIWSVGVELHSEKLINRCMLMKNQKEVYEAWNTVVLRIGTLAVPGTIITLVTLAILLYLARANHSRRQQMEGQEGDSLAGVSRGVLRGVGRGVGGRGLGAGRPPERQLTAMLIAVCVAFIWLRLPYTITYYVDQEYQKLLSQLKETTTNTTELTIISPLVATTTTTRQHNMTTEVDRGAGNDARFARWLRDPWTGYYLHAALRCTDVIASSNYLINFFLYCLCGSYFRQQIVVVICCRHRRPRRHLIDTSLRRLSPSSAALMWVGGGGGAGGGVVGRLDSRRVSVSSSGVVNTYLFRWRSESSSSASGPAAAAAARRRSNSFSGINSLRSTTRASIV